MPNRRDTRRAMGRKRAGRLRPGEGLAYVIVFGVLATGLYAAIFYRMAHDTATARPQAIPPFYHSAAQAMPLPSTLDPKRFPVPKISKAYAIAKSIPEVLVQQPCYCHCVGHRSLLDCFKDEHAASCSICIEEAMYVDQQNAKGQCTQAIRDGIIRGDWKLRQETTQLRE